MRVERRGARGGFTLIELLLVMVILAVLAGIAVPTYTKVGRDSKAKATKATISNIKTALHGFEVQFDRFPTTAEGLQALVSAPATLPQWDHAFLEKVPVDGWGHTFKYVSPGAVHPESFDILSFGEDNMEGTADDIDQDAI